MSQENEKKGWEEKVEGCVKKMIEECRKMKHWHEEHHWHKHHHGLFWGILFILVGVLWLLRNYEVIAFQTRDILPAIIIILGLKMLCKRFIKIKKRKAKENKEQ